MSIDLMQGLSIRSVIKKSLIIWLILCSVTLIILITLGEEALFALDILAADGNSNINFVKDSISGESLVRLVIPGLNSNTVAIQCAIGICIVPLLKSRKFN